MPKRSLQPLIDNNQTNDFKLLSSEATVLFELLKLIVDIKYRHRYGEQFADRSFTDYSVGTQLNNVLTDQVPPVDEGLSGRSRRELSGK